MALLARSLRGFGAARDFVRSAWEPAMSGGAGQRKHPKAALQEWAAGNRRKPPCRGHRHDCQRLCRRPHRRLSAGRSS